MAQDINQDHIADIWEAIADRIGAAPAIIQGDRVTSWHALEDRAARIATALTQAGIGAGSTVAIDLYNCPEWIETFFAVIKVGAMPANVNYRYLDDELVHLLSDSKAQAIVFHASLGARIMALRDRLPMMSTYIVVDDGTTWERPADVRDYEEVVTTHAPASRGTKQADGCFLSYTGGTTGLPKGVLVQLSRLMSALPTLGPMFAITPEDARDPVATAERLHCEGKSFSSLPASPLMHSTGFTMTAVPTLLFGGTVVLLEGRSFDGTELCHAIARHKVRMIAIVGDAIARPLLRAIRDGAGHLDISTLKVISSAGVAWSAETKAGLLEMLPEALLIDACGASEGSTYGTRAYRAGDNLSGTNFIPAPGLHVQDENGTWRPAQKGMTGLLSNRTASIGYYLDPEKSARSFFLLNGEQYVVPGDYGRIEEDGSLTLIGRTSGVINTGGEKVHQEEVEDVLREMHGIEDCLVFGMPDERFGQRVTAVVSLSQDLTQAEIIAHTRSKLAHYKAPKDLFIVTQVPRGPNGKPDYPAAKALAETYGATPVTR